MVFFYKQKTAYEMRISDWSSDVCSSDLFILTDGRTKVANDTRVLIQKVLDDYKAGVVITQVALQRTEPPASVIDAFRDVQAAQADRERAQNEAEAYRNDIIPRARGQAQHIVQPPDAHTQTGHT